MISHIYDFTSNVLDFQDIVAKVPCTTIVEKGITHPVECLDNILKRQKYF